MELKNNKVSVKLLSKVYGIQENKLRINNVNAVEVYSSRAFDWEERTYGRFTSFYKSLNDLLIDSKEYIIKNNYNVMSGKVDGVFKVIIEKENNADLNKVKEFNSTISELDAIIKATEWLIKELK